MKKILFSLVALALVIGVVGAGTFAYFSDTESSTANTFTAGTLGLGLGTQTWHGSVNNMKPGDVVTFEILVETYGSLPLNYTITPSLTGALAAGANPTVITKVLVDDVVKTPAPYTDSLSAIGGIDVTDVIKVEITMPAAAGNEYQSAAGSLTVTIDAVQQP